MKVTGKIFLILGLLLFILGISMFVFAASSFTNTGEEYSSFDIKLGEYAMVFWIPSIIIGMLLGGVGLFLTIKK
ncbi:hypothetical protein GM921_02095 [Pedobacter sp. LMG 31464]|uniref:Uncharacterized protein n=1 Tax=Pedobacter planticolens TaxID=2679964 RepID=A0A923DWB4_9SPHI|nr:hypothetical protein [Pedobacter planticolens]MBB2144265.1 hypothetical protein [Pedobacter planticolens]